MSQLFTSMGQDRDTHAALIMNAKRMWSQYADEHKDVFKDAGLKKYIVVDSKGSIIENAYDKAELVRNADGTVRHEDFLVIQDTIVQIRERSLNGIADLQSGGMTVGASITDQLIGFENISDADDAKQEMNPQNFDNNDSKFGLDMVPNPITHSTFSIPWRQNGFNYKGSIAMQRSIRKVSERLEQTLFNGNTAISVSYQSSNYPIYGYTTHPNRGTDTIADWTAAANVKTIVTDCVAAIGLMFSNQAVSTPNSVMLYVANNIWSNLQNDYNATYPTDETVYERIKKIAEIKDVKPAEKLAAGTAVMVEMSSESVQLAVAQDVIVIPHTKTNPFQPTTLTCYAAMVHHIKKDVNNKTGVMHLTT